MARRALAPIVAGTVLGAARSVATTRLPREQLYGVVPGDRATVVTSAALLLLVSLATAAIPARRGMRVSPFLALAG